MGHWEDIKVRAKVYTINGFSAHADRVDILAWIKQISGLNLIYLIHGETDKQELFKAYLHENIDTKVHIVKKEERIHL